ncbi:hypothetical protein Mgra_00007455 [Meloidogyne graminicola]|uniref:Uncharacterized protein n=1 Tax=Meloidogyne graminicola TaxID=189291 RepID=A0A8S9ZIJ5_9BILA|nr:hypothetical protein Mgra_00007455 [Meloidogyne graminicola]
MEYNESTSKYKCIACNKHQINNVKRRVIEHYRTKNHKENIASKISNNFYLNIFYLIL